jgi:threonine aldolase
VSRSPIIPGAQFASDNTAGICPSAWNALAEANAGYAKGYGDDAWTARAADKIREIFNADADVYFTFNGTAANALSLAAVCQSYHSVICSDVAHIEVDECGAPEFFSNGSKLLVAASDQGKLVARDIAQIARRRSDIHFPKPSVVSITQTTETGTVYSLADLAEIGSVARDLGLFVHMDGARFANAVASLGATPAQLTTEAGVDVLCLGGTKNGMPIGDAVVFFRRDLAREFDYRCKQAGQLASKMRFISAPWVAMLESGDWLVNARHANAMAERLEKGLRELPGVEIPFPRQANAIFPVWPAAWTVWMRAKGWYYYDFFAKPAGAARLMCSWATTEADVDQFLIDLNAASRQA